MAEKKDPHDSLLAEIDSLQERISNKTISAEEIDKAIADIDQKRKLLEIRGKVEKMKVAKNGKSPDGEEKAEEKKEEDEEGSIRKGLRDTLKQMQGEKTN